MAEGGYVMKINAKEVMDKAAGASTGLAVAVAFLNVALLLVKIVQTVSEDVVKSEENN